MEQTSPHSIRSGCLDGAACCASRKECLGSISPREGPRMKAALGRAVYRRDLLRFAIATAAASSGVLATEPAAAEPLGNANKRKSRYQANSPEVQEFYRVNRYPPR